MREPLVKSPVGRKITTTEEDMHNAGTPETTSMDKNKLHIAVS